MKKTDKRIGVMTMGFFLFFGLFHFLSEDREMSRLENRYLQERPPFSVSRLISGKWGSDVESWMVDQFPLREQWVGINSSFEHTILGKSELNGIYISGDELFTKTKEPGAVRERNLQALEKLADRLDAPLTVMAVPTATTLLSDRLPDHAVYHDENETIFRLTEGLGEERVLDISDLLAENTQWKKLYFRMDHHWTAEGAYIGYKAFAEHSGLKPFEREEFVTERVTESFYGTAYAKVGLWRLKPEAIDVLVPEGGYQSLMTVGDEANLPLFDEQKLLEYDKYAYFLGGNQPVHIIDSALETGRRLVVIKDSYAHIMAPFLSLHYDRVVLIDPRYINADPYELIESFDPTEILVLMNGNNLGQENGLSLFLRY